MKLQISELYMRVYIEYGKYYINIIIMIAILMVFMFFLFKNLKEIIKCCIKVNIHIIEFVNKYIPEYKLSKKIFTKPIIIVNLLNIYFFFLICIKLEKKFIENLYNIGKG